MPPVMYDPRLSRLTQLRHVDLLARLFLLYCDGRGIRELDMARLSRDTLIGLVLQEQRRRPWRG
jgi:hypothetical protein